ncbi:MAG: M28 family peptidase [Planctomycetales bacterium]|nr:M28 family peptidase [Planctomycetales bacterium]
MPKSQPGLSKCSRWIPWSLLLLVLPYGWLHAADITAATLDRLQADLTFIASDELEGRNSGSPGIRKAAEFIHERFRTLGLQTDAFNGTPFQDFSIPGEAQVGPAERNALVFGGIEFINPPAFGDNYTPVSLGNNGSFAGPVVFVGYGITAPELGYDDYEGLDVTGKVVVVLRKEPGQGNANSKFGGSGRSRHAFFSTKESNAALHKAAALILVNDSATVDNSGNDQLPGVAGAGQGQAGEQIPTFYCSRSLISPVIQAGTGSTLKDLEQAIDSELRPMSKELGGIVAHGECFIEQIVTPVRNVVGFLPGRGELANEFVVVGAHYDHVGMGGGSGSLAAGTIAVHNGADDNGSGTVAMLEIARRMSADESNSRRSLIFIAFTGEEKGLLGSKHYVRNPRWPLENTVAMLNLDMVGRLRDDSLTVYGTGTAENFRSMLREANASIGFEISEQPEGFGPSDHSSFYGESVPVLHFFTGLHNEYHRPNDDVELVNFEGLSRIVTLVTDLTARIATDVARPKFLKVEGVARINGRGNRRPRRRAVMGVELAQEERGVSVVSLTLGAAADQAGIKLGDVIFKVEDSDILDIVSLQSMLASKRPGDSVRVTVRRENEILEFDVLLGSG